MANEISDIRHRTEIRNAQAKNKDTNTEDFVLEKSIFNNVFEKDIRRIFIYKKAERLAKAIHLITPAFVESMSLKNRIETIAIGLVDAAIQPSAVARTTLSHELLALSSILSMARAGGILSHMNAEIIVTEAHILLQEVAAYEEPRLFLDEVLTLSEIAKGATKRKYIQNTDTDPALKRSVRDDSIDKGRLKDNSIEQVSYIKDRREAVMSVIKSKGNASIKDISTIIRDVSEKTVQRELSALVENGLIVKKGERRWSTYSLA